MKSLNSLILGLVTLQFLSCATTYKDFKTDKVKTNEGVAIGQINVKYNGKDYNKECAVCLNSINGPCQNLLENGIVFMNIPKGEVLLRRIACKDVSSQHYNMKNASFQVVDGVNYFGRIDIDWTNNGGFKATDMFGLVGALASESKNDGILNVSVQNGDLKKVVTEYEQHTRQENIKVNKSIVKITSETEAN